MNNTGGALSFDAVINDSDFQRKFDEMERRIRGFTSSAVSETKKVDDQFKMLGNAIATYFTVDALQNVASKIITVRGEFQQLETAFRVMLGSKEKANALMIQIADLAANTPFSLKEVASGAKSLIAYGTSADNAVKTLRMLGDVASGISAPINDIVYLYGTLQTQGRAYSVDIKQFAGRGIPIYKELAAVLGTTTDKVNSFVEDGKVGFKEVEKAFQNMTSAGGMFNGSMLEQSKTIGGLISTLKDNIDQMFNDIGKNQEGFITGSIKMGIEMTKNYQSILDILTVLTATYGAYKTAVILATVVQSVATSTANGWTIATLLQYRALLLAENAQKALNATMLANPYVLAATLLVGLATATYLLSKNTDSAVMAQEAMADAAKGASESMAGETAKIETLKAQINSEVLSRQTRNEKLKEFIAIAPEQLKAITLENFNTIESKKAIDDYIVSKTRQLEMKQIEAELEDSILRKQKLKAGEGSTMSYGLSIIDNALGTRLYEDNIKKQINVENEFQEKLKQRTIALAKADTAKVKTITPTIVIKNDEWYKNEIKKLTELQQKYDVGSKKYQEYQLKIDALNNKVNPKKAKKEEEVAPFGTIKYWEQVSQKAKEATEISKNPADRSRQNAIMLDADRKAEALRKELVVKSFDDELEEKKKQYDLYEKWVQFVNKESADAQFATLISSNKTYADWLKGQIDTLQKQQDVGMISEKGKTNLISLSVEYNSITGGQSAVDLFKEGLEKAKNEAKSLVEYLTLLQEQQKALADDTSTAGIEKNVALANEIIATQKAVNDELKQYLENANDYGTQILNIQKKYSNLRLDLEKQYKDKTNAEYIKSKEIIKKGEEGELKEIEGIRVRNLESFKKLQDSIFDNNRKGLKLRIEAEKEFLKDVAKIYGEQSDEYKKQAIVISKLQDDLHKDTLNQINDFAQLAGELGSVLQQVGGGFAQLGGLLSGLASSSKLITTSFDKSATTADKVQAGVSGIISLVNTLISASNQRNAAEKEYQNNALAFEHNYKLAINERLGLMSSSEENIFVKNFQGRLTDSFKMFNDASAKYKEALDKLNQGQAKTGQQNGINWGNVGSATGAGAAAGAAIGSIVPGLGTAIGAVAGAYIGFFTGLFGGKTKDDTWGSLIQLYPTLITKSANGQKVFNKDLAQTLITNGQVDDATKLLLQSTIDWTTQMEKAKEAVKGIISELAGNLGNSLRDSLVNAFKEGTDAAKAFGDSVSAVLEDIISKMIFNQIFSKSFDELQSQMMASSDLANGGDGSWIDDFGNFFSQADGLWTQFYESLKTAQTEAGKYGLNIFQKTQTNTSTNNTVLSGAIKGMSEETASILAGQFNAIRINSATTVQLTREGVGYLQNISKYSVQYLPYLEGIDAKLKTLNEVTSLRAKGG